MVYVQGQTMNFHELSTVESPFFHQNFHGIEKNASLTSWFNPFFVLWNFPLTFEKPPWKSPRIAAFSQQQQQVVPWHEGPLRRGSATLRLHLGQVPGTSDGFFDAWEISTKIISQSSTKHLLIIHQSRYVNIYIYIYNGCIIYLSYDLLHVYKT